MTIYILTVSNEDDSYIMPFSTQEKATNFIINNFSKDNPKKITNELFEGKNNSYVIESILMDQERL